MGATPIPLKGPPKQPPSPSHANDVIPPPDPTDIVKDAYDYFFIDGGGPESLFRDLGITVTNGTSVVNMTCCTVVNETILYGNSSHNGSFVMTDGDEPLGDVIVMAITSVILGLMILITVIGNVFVIAAIILERHLQNVANYLVASLAVADLMVACLVMPLGAVYEISKGWILGPELCDMWTSSDVLCCTASILHLVAIAVDRYWAVTNVDYIHSRTGNRIFIMIVLVWGVAVIVSLAPQFGWKDPDYLDRINIQQRCLVSQDIGYQIFATCSTFYVPLFVILVLYWKIFQTARKRIHRRTQVEHRPVQSYTKKTFLGKRKYLNIKKYAKKKQSATADVLATSLVMVEGNSTNTMNTVEDTEDGAHSQKEDQTAFTITKDKLPGTTESPEKSSTNNGSASHVSDISQAEVKPEVCVEKVAVVKIIKDTKKESIEAKRERKAAKTLAIITGAFVVCWLPFFIMALLMPLCDACAINDYVASFFLWLGYFNSTLNPVIYTIFSPEFRQAFKRILFGVHRNNKKYYRSGKL